MEKDKSSRFPAARRGDWKTRPMPKEQARFTLDRVFTAAEMAASLNKLLDRWTELPYDHYREWLSEIADSLQKAGKTDGNGQEDQ